MFRYVEKYYLKKIAALKLHSTTSHSESLYALFVNGVCMLKAAASDNTGST